MATNLALDDRLILSAQKAGHHKTKKEAVTTALEEYIAHKRQQETVKSFGTFTFYNRYDYKKGRQR